MCVKFYPLGDSRSKDQTVNLITIEPARPVLISVPDNLGGPFARAHVIIMGYVVWEIAITRRIEAWMLR